MKSLLVLAALVVAATARKDKLDTDNFEEKVTELLPRIGYGDLATLFAVKLKVVFLVLAVGVVLVIVAKFFTGGFHLGEGCGGGGFDQTFANTFDSYGPPSHGSQGGSYGYGRAAKANDVNFFHRILKSIDFVDLGFSALEVQNEACRKRLVCEVDQLASKHAVVGFALKLIGPSLSRYRGKENSIIKDCAILYSDCTDSKLDLFRTKKPPQPPLNATETPSSKEAADGVEAVIKNSPSHHT